MNSYPAELLTQLAPVIFVAGLDVPPDHQQDQFAILTRRLRDALLTRKTAIYQPDKTKSFHVVFVDKSVRFPPRKILPDDPQYLTAHSPLSPLTPTSPLFPDGLIAPIWIRKHTTFVPSVFVLFLRIFELPQINPSSPLHPPDPEHERERADEERQRDTELAAEIAQRKKSTAERGIKLTVVLTATRRMLDDPSLDARLTYIRRQSGLDSRAALFVLSPVSPSELGDFVQSLQQALYEPALEYYTNHSKRVRRKRNRHAQAGSTHVPTTSPPHSTVRPLRPEGWTVRYEYKMACFAEFRGEDEVALKHYQDAYAMLIVMFASTAILPPRTKRWAEAKVLADCVNVKVLKLYLYNNEHALALSQHSTHVRRFAELSRGWGIGEETYEFWSWMARQYRVLAELLEQGTHSNLVIPSHRPVSGPQPPALPAPLPSTSQGVAPALPGINASHALQHPGYYYYMAARYTELRRERFLAALKVETMQTTPGFANERKVDHPTIVLELYTKSYELFKKYSPVNGQNQAQGRLTLWIACRIAQTYYDAGKFAMAVRFFERIARTYRREKWTHMLRPLLATWYSCTQQLGDTELCIRLLVEMLGHGLNEGEDAGSLERSLLAVFKDKVPANPDETLVIDLSEALPIFESAVVFWSPEVEVGEQSAFQISLTAPPDVTISSLPFTELTVFVGGDVKPVVIKHVSSDPAGRVRRVDIGHIDPQDDDSPQEAEACLRWEPGDVVVFAGTISSAVPCSFRVLKLVLTLRENGWKIEIPFHPGDLRIGTKPAARWLSSLDPVRFTAVKRDDASILSVRHRPHRVRVSLDHQGPAYLDEEYPITIDITNTDTQELEVVVDVLLQPMEIDHAVNSIVLGDERSSGLIKGVSFGVLRPGVNTVKTLYLFNSGTPGNRMIDISVRSTSTATTSGPLAVGPTPNDLVDATETLQTMVVPTVEPIIAAFDVVYRRALGSRRGLADLGTFEETFWDDGDGGEAIVDMRFECAGPWGLEVTDVRLVKEDGKHAKVLENFLECAREDMFPAEYLPGDEFSDTCRTTLAPESDQDLPIPGPGKYEIDWRRIMPNGERGPLSTTWHPLPPLRPPEAGLVAHLSVPPSGKLHVPMSMHLTIRNQHPVRSANVTVQLEPNPSDGFIISGLRVGRVPILLPGTEEKLTWSLIPLDCGYIKVPQVKVVDRRKAIASAQGIEGANAEVETVGEVVLIVDVRQDERLEDGTALRDTGVSTVLVLP